MNVSEAHADIVVLSHWVFNALAIYVSPICTECYACQAVIVMPYPHCPVAPLSLSLGQGCTKTREQRFVIFWPHPLPCALSTAPVLPQLWILSSTGNARRVILTAATPIILSPKAGRTSMHWSLLRCVYRTLCWMASGLCVCFDKMSQSGMVVQNIFIVSLSNRFWHQFSKVNNALCPGTINVTTGSLLLSTSLNVHATQRSIINISSSMPACLPYSAAWLPSWLTGGSSCDNRIWPDSY